MVKFVNTNRHKVSIEAGAGIGVTHIVLGLHEIEVLQGIILCKQLVTDLDSIIKGELSRHISGLAKLKVLLDKGKEQQNERIRGAKATP